MIDAAGPRERRRTSAGTYGWRARIGLILPADNVLIEPELNALDLPGVSFHGLRLTATEPELMRSQAVELARTVTELGLDAVVYACAETSFNGGSGVRMSLAALIENECGKPVVTATIAMLAALEHLQIRRLALVTPYSAESGAILESTLAENGVAVTASVHRDFSRESDDPRVWYLTNRQPDEVAYEMARNLDRSRAEAVLIASTNLATLQIVDQLERDIGVPVISSNSSIVWWCMQRLGLSPGGLRLGRLLAADPAPAAGVSR
jgi:maleate isomerase